MKVSDYIAIISIIVTVIISLFGGLYTIITNTKKFELSEQYKKELLDWYGKVINSICKLKVVKKEDDKNIILQELSALIEIGRFYFPNIDKKDGFGKEKPSAYQGYRHIALDFLVLIYEIGKNDSSYQYINRIEEMQRQFTSIVFDVVSPNERIKFVKQYTNIIIPKGKSIEDFIVSDRTDTEIRTIFEYYK